MQPIATPARPQPAPSTRTLTLRKETLRRLTPAELRLAAGGAAAAGHPSNHPTACSAG